MKTFLRHIIVYVLSAAIVVFGAWLIGNYEWWKTVFAVTGYVFIMVTVILGLIWVLIDDEPI